MLGGFVESSWGTSLLHQLYQLQHGLTLPDYLTRLLQDSALQGLELVVGGIRCFSLGNNNILYS
jgi:hypothetical protein